MPDTTPAAPMPPPPPKKDEPPPPADEVVLLNTTKRMMTLILGGKHLASAAPGAPHRYKPVKLVTVHHAKSGELAMRTRKIPMPDTIRIPAGERLTVNVSATHCPDVKKALARKDLRIVPATKSNPKK